MADRTYEEVLDEIKAVRAERNELLQQQTPLEEVRDFNNTLDQVREALEQTGGDLDGVREQLGEHADALQGLGGQVRAALENETTQEILDGINSGLEQASDQIGNASELADQIDGVVNEIEDLLGESDASASSQIEALAERFEETVELLEPLISRIPVLGQFLKIYAMAIHRIAISVGKIEEVIQQRNRTWRLIFPGENAYNDGGTWQSRLNGRIRDLDRREIELVNEANAIASQPVPMGTGRTEVDHVIRAAMDECRGAENDYKNGSDSNTRATAMQARDEAWTRLARARTELQAVTDELERATYSLAHAPANQVNETERRTAAVQMAQGAVKRARQTVNDRGAEFDATQAAFVQADAPYQAGKQQWYDCLRISLLNKIPLANKSQGLTASEISLLNVILRQDHYIDQPLVTPDDVQPSGPSEVGYTLSEEERAELVSRQEAAAQRREAEHAALDAQPDQVWDEEAESYQPTDRSGQAEAEQATAAEAEPADDDDSAPVGFFAGIAARLAARPVRNALIAAGVTALAAAGAGIAFIGGDDGGSAVAPAPTATAMPAETSDDSNAATTATDDSGEAADNAGGESDEAPTATPAPATAAAVEINAAVDAVCGFPDADGNIQAQPTSPDLIFTRFSASVTESRLRVVFPADEALAAGSSLHERFPDLLYTQTFILWLGPNGAPPEVAVLYMFSVTSAGPGAGVTIFDPAFETVFARGDIDGLEVPPPQTPEPGASFEMPVPTLPSGWGLYAMSAAHRAVDDSRFDECSMQITGMDMADGDADLFTEILANRGADGDACVETTVTWAN